MEQLRQILLDHGARYPQMEPRDAVKLIYQNEFGGGHLIPDEAACLDYLRREYESVKQRPDLPLLEEIGSEIVRVNLAALDHHGYPLASVGTAFLLSAAVHHGNPDSFLHKLSTLKELTAEDKMPFSPKDLEAYLESYAAAGYPAVSHSETYRNTYHPAYRVIKKEFLSKQMP